MTFKNKMCLVVFFCVLFLFTHVIYATDDFNKITQVGRSRIELKIDSGGYYTASSWFTPRIVRNAPGGNFAWTVSGQVWYSKASKKWPSGYWESGGFTPPITELKLKTYRDPFICRTAIGLYAVSVAMNGETDIYANKLVLGEKGEVLKNSTLHLQNNKKNAYRNSDAWTQNFYI